MKPCLVAFVALLCVAAFVPDSLADGAGARRRRQNRMEERARDVASRRADDDGRPPDREEVDDRPDDAEHRGPAEDREADRGWAGTDSPSGKGGGGAERRPPRSPEESPIPAAVPAGGTRPTRASPPATVVIALAAIGLTIWCLRSLIRLSF